MTAIAVVVFVFGLIIGSFLNVCILRIPVAESVVFPPSHCPSCGKPIQPYDNIPVVSWLLLRKQLKYARALLMSGPIMPDRKDADALMFNRTPVADRDTFFPKLVPDSGKAGLQMSLGAIGVRESRVSEPVLVVTGRDDQFVVPRIAHALARKYKAPLKEYDTFAHHIMSEPGWERPAADIIAWMDSIGRM